MKKLRYIPYILIVLALVNSSCSDYLEKAPGVDVTEDDIFSSAVEVETFVTGTYYWGLLGDLPCWDTRDHRDCFTGAATDECEAANPWYWGQSHNQGTMSPTNTRDTRWNTHWIAIRRTNTLIDLIDEATFDDASYKKQVRGEAKFLRAYNYWQLFIKYGGVPILRHRFDIDDDFYIPRGTVAEMVEFMIEDCNNAIADLPTTYTTSLRGRVTKAAAAALKSRILLYAASPTFNTAKAYLDYGVNNNLICYGDYQESRWKDAADAAREAIKLAQEGGFALVTDKGADKNYQYMWETPDNTEIILAEKSKESCGPWHFPWGPRIPNTGANGFGQGEPATFNFIQKYEKKDGSKQSWNMSGGNDYMAKMKELDPRFAQSVAYQDQKWDNTQLLQLDFTQPDETGNKGGLQSGSSSAALVHKPVPYAVSGSPANAVIPNGIILRLGELYLNLAEALNECNGTPPAEAYEAVDEIRRRVDMPAWQRGLDQKTFRDKIRNERAVELAFEGHRLYDVVRWQIAEQEGVMKGNIYGLKVYRIPGVTGEYRYLPYVFESRTFNTRMYRYPFPQGEIEKMYLLQNPGYE